MEIIIGAQTDKGLKREVNEDAYSIFDEQNLFLVADGMGGHAGGRIASQLAIETVRDFIQSPYEANYSLIQIQNLLLLSEDLYQFETVKVTDLVLGKDLPEKALDLVKAVRLANRRVYNMAVAQPKLAGMGTTIVAAIFEANLIYICHVGDSRVYRLRAGNLEQLTEDHSWVNELLEDKEISEEEAANFKYKNVITRALGITGNVKVDLRIENVESGDLFLLCTDGLAGQIPDEQIRDVLNRSDDSLGTACRDLVKAANDSGGPDNITVVTFKVSKVPKEEYLPNPIIQVIGKEDEQVLAEEDKVLKRVYGKEKIKVSGEDKSPRQKAKESKPIKKELYLIIAIFVLGLLGGGIYLVARQPTETEQIPPQPQKGREVTVSDGFLTLTTVPSEANIFLDGKGLKELTPLTKYRIKPGKYTVKFTKFGYRTSREQHFSVLAGQEKQIEDKLISEAKINLIFPDPKTARQAVGAKIIIDDHDLGYLSPYQSAIAVPKGVHTLALEKKGFFIKIEFTLYEAEKNIEVK